VRVGSRARITARPFGRERRARNRERKGKKDLTGRAWASAGERERKGARSTAGVQGLPGGTLECGARPRGRAGTRVVEAGRARKGREAVPFWAGKREEGVNLGRVGRGGCWARVRGKVGGLGCWFWAGEKGSGPRAGLSWFELF